MMRVRLAAFVLACLAAAGAVWSAVFFYEGFLRGLDLLAAWIAARWSDEQIEAFMQYSVPLSLFLSAFSLILAFWAIWASLHSKKR